MKSRPSRLAVAALATTFLAATTAGGAFAAPGSWAASHPSRAEVNQRLSNQNNTIDRDRANGSLTGGQARQLHHEDRRIRQEERSMASQDGGHITRADRRALNQQENGVRRQIAGDTGRFDASHPRRAEVNDRLANQNRRIDSERRDGEITGAQARQLHHEDNQVAQEERSMASQDGGHITRADQTALNQQENGISRQIYQDR
jgi:hypothetical protein